MLRYISIIGGILAILAVLWAGSRKLFGHLRQLEELPQIKQAIEQLDENQNSRHLENVQKFVALERDLAASTQWHDDHLRREHGHPHRHEPPR